MCPVLATRAWGRCVKVIEADVIWTPAHFGDPGAGNVRVEEHGSGWKRTPRRHIGSCHRPSLRFSAFCGASISHGIADAKPSPMPCLDEDGGGSVAHQDETAAAHVAAIGLQQERLGVPPG